MPGHDFRDCKGLPFFTWGRIRGAPPQCLEASPARRRGPVKWHLAHTTWFFETFVLEAHAPGYRAFDPAYRVLFNSYYHGVGVPET